MTVEDVTKSFGGTTALKGVSLQVQLGEVHALLGHNGSGKSTLIKIVSGYYRPDCGRIRVNGHEIRYPTNALSLNDYGVGFMHQDIGLVPTLSVLENLRIGQLQTGVLGHICWSKEREKVSNLLASFGLSLSPDWPVSRLSGSERSVVGVIRAFQNISGGDSLEANGGLVILDEPTAALPEVEKTRLFNVIKNVASRGVGVLLVTHHLEESMEFADHVSVLRDGQLVASGPIQGHTYDTLAELVVGHRVEKTIERTGKPNLNKDQEALNVSNLAGNVLNGVSFTAYKGEIVGLSGLMGAGHEEIPFLVYGAQKARRGTVSVCGTAFRPDPINARRLGMALISGDRIRAGGVLTASVAENVTLPVLATLAGKLRWLCARREKSLVQSLLERLQVRIASHSLPFSVLSGGSQQKVLVGRWIGSGPEILLLQEPTAGVDIGASQEIIAMLREFADSGGTVLFSSEQYEDVVNLSDRVLVLRDGKIVCELQGDSVTVERIVASCHGKPDASQGEVCA